MKDQSRTKQELLEVNSSLKQKILELEQLESECEQANDKRQRSCQYIDNF